MTERPYAFWMICKTSRMPISSCGKHHAAQRQADQINETARKMGESWLPRYGGKISSEWFFSKLLQILQERPDIYSLIDRFVEAADWVIWQLTGVETRNTCTAGYKAMVQDGDYPDKAYFRALDPAFENVVDEKVGRKFAELGSKAGELTPRMADMMGLPAGIAVAVAQRRRPCHSAGCQSDRSRNHDHGHGHILLPHPVR